MKPNKPTIKTCKQFGNSGHILLSKKDVGHKFMVFPQNQGVIFNEIFEKYLERIKKLSTPFLIEVLTPGEFKQIIKAYEKIIKIKRTQKGLFTQTHLKVLEERLLDLEKYTIDIIPDIILDLNKNLPKPLYHKLVKIIETKL